MLVVTLRYTPSNPENNVAWLEDSPLIPCQIRNLRPRHVDRWKFRANLSFWKLFRENWHLNSETRVRKRMKYDGLPRARIIYWSQLLLTERRRSITRRRLELICARYLWTDGANKKWIFWRWNKSKAWDEGFFFFFAESFVSESDKYLHCKS